MQSKRKSIVSRLDFERWQSSTKIEALLEELTKQRQQDGTIKSIVFSQVLGKRMVVLALVTDTRRCAFRNQTQFTQFLDLMDWVLQRNGFRTVKLDGRMTPQHRAAVVDAFTNDPQVQVALISLKAGGVALNLTAASTCFLTDLWWNPCVELQGVVLFATTRRRRRRRNSLEITG